MVSGLGGKDGKMAVIHMETENVRTLAKLLLEQSQTMSERVEGVVQQVEGAPWQGGSRDEFVSRCGESRQRFNQLSEQMQELHEALNREVAQWEEAASIFGGGVAANSGMSGLGAWESWKSNDLGRSERLVNQLLDFENSKTGKQLAEEAASVGMLFVIMDGGRILGSWGKPGGERIKIMWGDMDNAYGYFDGNDQIRLNYKKYKDNDHLYRHTLIHEMQHAIDFHKPNVDLEKIDKLNNLTQQQIDQMSPDELEKIFTDVYTEHAKTEVNAHDIGYAFEGSDIGKVLDRSDGVYTKEEFKFIINKRSYEENYEGYINEQLKEWFGDNTKYRADVWVDGEGKIHVDIDQSRPLIPRFIDSLDDRKI